MACGFWMTGRIFKFWTRYFINMETQSNLCFRVFLPIPAVYYYQGDTTQGSSLPPKFYIYDSSGNNISVQFYTAIELMYFILPSSHFISLYLDIYARRATFQQSLEGLEHSFDFRCLHFLLYLPFFFPPPSLPPYFPLLLPYFVLPLTKMY